ncbi:spherulin-4-like [Venturia canescens]|uniref:spherulin-4-like n=1 Tax=Venturia canescens TaxID=32260 RepID=UPI001C9D173F|nr:spherulin-4-like [Venturia canescens]
MEAVGTCLGILLLSAVSQAAPGLLIPLYAYPLDSDPTWTTVKSSASSNPSVEFIAVVNPNSGPGDNIDAIYGTAIAQLASAGVKCIGYVPTNYGAVAAKTATENMDKYARWYPIISGFFFDEMTNIGNKESYYTSLTTHAVSIGKPFTVGNPGTSTTRAYFDSVNNTVIYETAKLPQPSKLNLGFPRSRCSMIAYDVAASQVNQSYINDILKYTSYIYITDDKLDNPYDRLPTYFNQLVEYVRAARI